MTILIALLFATISIIGLLNAKKLGRGKYLSIICSLLLIVAQVIFFIGPLALHFGFGGMELLTVSGLLTILIFIPYFLPS